MSTPLRRAGTTALSVLALVAVASGAAAAGTPTPVSANRPAPTGTADNGCGNPILATDLAGWATAPGDEGARLPTGGHITANRELLVRPAEPRTRVTLPQRPVREGAVWDLTADLRVTGTAAARVEATWFDEAGDALGRARGRWITVAADGRYTRVGDRFVAPLHAVRAEVAVAVAQRAADEFGVTMCSYRPVEQQTPVAVGTTDPAPPLGPRPADPTPRTAPPTRTTPPPTTPPTTPSTTAPPTTTPATTTPATTAPPTTPPPTTTPATTTPATTVPTTPPTTAPPTTAPPPTTPPATTVPTTAPPTTPAGPTTTTPPVPTPDEAGGTDPVTAVPLTAAERYGWGTPLPASDEFDYTGAPDPARWAQAGECWPGHNGNGRRCASRSTVTGGSLVMTGLANGDTGWLASTHGTRYGRWEARVRSVETGRGGDSYHPVLIVWPDSEDWPADGEYDFLENSAPGERCAEAFLHYPHPTLPVQQEHAQETDCGEPLSEWHTVAFEWTPDHVRGFLDGEQWFSFSGGAGPGGRSAIQAMPSGHLTIQLDNFAGTGLAPATLEVDWVRMYAV